MGSPVEIERKFHLPCWPEYLPSCGENYRENPIAQGYLTTGEVTVRLRRYGNAFFLTVKSGKGLVREETEVALTEEQFASLWPLTEGHRLEKIRSVVPWRGWNLEIDRYLGRLAPLQVVEVEFPNEAAARDFVPPEFFGVELTGHPEFLNSSLVHSSRPPDMPKSELA